MPTEINNIKELIRNIKYHYPEKNNVEIIVDIHRYLSIEVLAFEVEEDLEYILDLDDDNYVYVTCGLNDILQFVKNYELFSKLEKEEMILRLV